MTTQDMDILARKIVSLEKRHNALARTQQLPSSSVRLATGDDVAVTDTVEATQDVVDEAANLGDQLYDVGENTDSEAEYTTAIPEWIIGAGEVGNTAWDGTQFAVDLSRELETELAEAKLELDQALLESAEALAEANTARQEAALAVQEAENAITAAGVATDLSEAAQTAATNAQATAGNAQTAADQAAADALAAANAASDAQGAADAAVTTANAKGKVIIQSAAPAAADRLPQNLWIDTTGGANTPKRWTTGSTWVTVTDKAATDAAAAAATAQTAATNAYNEAVAAATAAGNAQTSADGKNTVWYQDNAPTGTSHKTGDTWFDTNDGNRIYRWNGSWVAAQFGTNAISDTAINAAKLAANAVTEGKILNGAITNDKLSTAVQNAITTAQSTASNAQTVANSAQSVASAAQSAASNAQDDADQAIADALAAANAVSAVRSRGNDLITNGNASLGSLNFSTFVLEKGDQPVGAQGAFWAGSNAQVSKLLDEFIQVDPSKSYIASMAVKQVNPGVTSRFYYGLSPYDAYGYSIQPGNYMERSGTRTALAEALKPGDTKIVLASASGWYQGASAYLRQVSFWSYVDQSGKLWEPGTYTRILSGTDTWNEGGITGNTITLRTPWSGDTFPAGTVVGNTLSGGTYMYAPGLNNTAVTGEWTTYTQTVPFTGVHTDSSLAATTRFPAATASVRVALLSNYGVSGGTSKQLFANVSLSDVAAAQSEAVTAQNIANAKGKVIIQSAAPAAADRLVQNLWIDTTGGANTPKRWVSGTTWAVVTDKAATDAAAAAVTAQNAANAAQSRADDAHTIASGAATAASAAQSAASAAQTAANNAQTTANGKNKIVRSTADASSPGNYVAGDQWWKYNGSQITAMWIHSGSAWVSQTLTDSVITNLNAGSITAGTISAARLSATNIKSVLVSTGALEAANIMTGAITAASGIIADAAIGTAKIIDGSITTAKIKDLAVTNAEIANGTIQNAKIANLDAAKITTGFLAAARIRAGTIVADKLATNAVTAVKIAANAVTAAKINAGAVTTVKLDALAVTAEKIAAGAIIADKIAANAITTAKLDAEAINGMTIVGALIKTAPTGQRLELDVNGLRSVNASNAIVGALSSDTGGLLLSGSLTSYPGGNTNRATLSNGQLSFDLAGSPGAGTLTVSSTGIRKLSGSSFSISHGSAAQGSDIGLYVSGSNSIILGGNVIFQGDTDWASLALAAGYTGSFRYIRKAGFVEVRFDINGSISGDTALTTAIPVGFRPSSEATQLTSVNAYIDPALIRERGVLYFNDLGILRGTGGGSGTATRVRGSAFWKAEN